jgi:hypothetical protein
MWPFKKDPEKDPEDIRFWLNGTPETFHRYEKSKDFLFWNIEYNLNEEIVKKLQCKYGLRMRGLSNSRSFSSGPFFAVLENSFDVIKILFKKREGAEFCRGNDLLTAAFVRNDNQILRFVVSHCLGDVKKQYYRGENASPIPVLFLAMQHSLKKTEAMLELGLEIQVSGSLEQRFIVKRDRATSLEHFVTCLTWRYRQPPADKNKAVTLLKRFVDTDPERKDEPFLALFLEKGTVGGINLVDEYEKTEVVEKKWEPLNPDYQVNEEELFTWVLEVVDVLLEAGYSTRSLEVSKAAIEYCCLNKANAATFYSQLASKGFSLPIEQGVKLRLFFQRCTSPEWLRYFLKNGMQFQDILYRHKKIPGVNYDKPKFTDRDKEAEWINFFTEISVLEGILEYTNFELVKEALALNGELTVSQKIDYLPALQRNSKLGEEELKRLQMEYWY